MLYEIFIQHSWPNMAYILLSVPLIYPYYHYICHVLFLYVYNVLYIMYIIHNILMHCTISITISTITIVLFRIIELAYQLKSFY